MNGQMRGNGGIGGGPGNSGPLTQPKGQLFPLGPQGSSRWDGYLQPEHG